MAKFLVWIFAEFMFFGFYSKKSGLLIYKVTTLKIKRFEIY